MKISIVTGFFLPVPPLRGGSTEKIWDRLAREFAAAGHEVTFISRTWPGLADREARDGVQHIRVRGANHARTLAANLWHDVRWGLRVARALPPADVVICNTVTLPVWLRRVKPAAGRVAVVLARMPKGHGRAYGNVDLLLSLSTAVTERIRAENPRLAGRIAPFPFPIDWQLHASARASSTVHAPLTIGYVGRVHPEKGVALLVNAASRLGALAHDLPPWQLELVGPIAVAEGGGGEGFRGTLVNNLPAHVRDRIAFRGPEYDPAALARRYATMDIFCYPSVGERGETFGVAIAEAMAARCAPVVSRLDCFRDLVRDGVTGLVFDHAAADADAQLAAALDQLLRNPTQRAALAENAQVHARQFDYAHAARSVLEILTRLVATGR